MKLPFTIADALAIQAEQLTWYCRGLTAENEAKLRATITADNDMATDPHGIKRGASIEYQRCLLLGGTAETYAASVADYD